MDVKMWRHHWPWAISSSLRTHGPGKSVWNDWGEGWKGGNIELLLELWQWNQKEIEQDKKKLEQDRTFLMSKIWASAEANGGLWDGRVRSATDPLPRKEPSLVTMITLNHLKSLEIVVREYSTRIKISELNLSRYSESLWNLGLLHPLFISTRQWKLQFGQVVWIKWASLSPKFPAKG